jgi:hypothetical protein
MLIAIHPDRISWAIARNPELLNPDTGNPCPARFGEYVDNILENQERSFALTEEEFGLSGV